VDVVVDADGGEPAAVAADMHRDAGSGRRLPPAQSNDVVLQRAGAAVVGHGAELEGCAAAVGEEPFVERAKPVRAPVARCIAGRLADVPIRLECCHHRVDIAGRERPVVLADDVGRLEVRIRLQQRWPGTRTPDSGQRLK